MGHCNPALLRIYTKVSSTQRVLQMTYRNVRALAAKVTVCLCWLPAPEQGVYPLVQAQAPSHIPLIFPVGKRVQGAA